MTNEPPYTITPTIVTLVEQIGEAGPLSLRRANRIRTIRGSLAIEGNTLSEGEIRTILEGKTVVAPPREVQEVRNAIKVYDQLLQWESTREANLLTAHKLMMTGLIDDAGVYRSGDVGVMGKESVIHVAPQASRVPQLMADLFGWLSTTDAHPLIASAVFHYEFEFIHPFSDGNGRIGRLWQTLILSRWRPLFGELPVESMIHQRQEGYYEALRACGAAGESTQFVTFVLQAIADTIIATDQVSDQVSDQVGKILVALRGGPKSAAELMAALGLKHRPSFRERYLKPALASGRVVMTKPEKPRAKNQRYRLVEEAG